MEITKKNIHDFVSKYYSEKIRIFGKSPQGVDWNGDQGQTLRFSQLCKIIDDNANFSINDYGCGYGALLSYLLNRYESFNYSGIDIVEEMISLAERDFKKYDFARFDVSSKPVVKYDYTIASGVFNVKAEYTDIEWINYIKDTLFLIDKYSKKGFSFNCLTSYSDREKMKSHLYYANPCYMFDYCKNNFSQNVALIHDYGLYEFTVHVRK